MSEPRKYLRFKASDRIEHLVLILSFGLLGLTGLIQKFHTVALAEWLVGAMGGIEAVRIVHRIAAVVMMLQTVYHLGTAGYKMFVLRVRFTMLPGIRDVRNAIGDVLYNLGLREEKPPQGRYSWPDKLEYWAVVWGTIVMGVTGFMLWNPIASVRLLPGAFVPAAKAAHGGEALLAVLAIIVWHLYNEHIRHFNKSMFTGYLTEHEMEELHPLELEEIKAGVTEPPIPPDVLSRRRRNFFLAFTPLAVAMLVAVYFFVNVEETAIATVPPPEDVEVYAPLTATPAPTSDLSAVTLPVDASPIPHLVAGKEDCRSCHSVDADLPWPADHEGRSNDFCHACHAPVLVPATLHPIEGHEACLACHGQGQVAEFGLDTHEGRADADCQTCHDPAGVAVSLVLHPTEGHEDCLMCHGSEAFKPYPANHEGWGNEFCLLCHIASQEPPSDNPHPFPQNHDGAGGNCMLCHLDGDLTTYSCQTCHAETVMEDVHAPRGMAQTEGSCTLCHPTAEKP
jgi:cytochrome b subunit of formate dehydrogenase